MKLHELNASQPTRMDKRTAIARELAAMLSLVATLTACATNNKAPENQEGGLKITAAPPPASEATGAQPTNTNEPAAAPAMPKKKVSPYIGLSGYLTRPPMFDDAIAQQMFDRCAPIEIVKIHTEKKAIQVTAKQGNNTFIISGINRKPFKKSGHRLKLLDKYFAKNLDVISPREPSSATNVVCDGQVRHNMSTEEFRFIAGDPEFHSPVTTPQGNFDVWTFVGTDRNKPRFYYFAAGKLYSWTK